MDKHNEHCADDATPEGGRPSTEEAIKDQLWALRRNTERGRRYYAKRERFLGNVARFFKFAVVFLGAGTTTTVWLQYEIMAIGAALLVSFISLLDMVFEPGRAEVVAGYFKRRYHDLQIMLEPDNLSAAMIDKAKHERLEIERDEPAVLRALDLICENEVRFAHGSTELYRLSFYHYMLCHICTFDSLLPQTVNVTHPKNDRS